jgi:hypothetical protein
MTAGPKLEPLVVEMKRNVRVGRSAQVWHEARTTTLSVAGAKTCACGLGLFEAAPGKFRKVEKSHADAPAGTRQ